MSNRVVPAEGPRARSWRREWPFAVGLTLGLALLLHPAWPRGVQPLGADWETWLASAGHLLLDPMAYEYNGWRRPLYPLLLGLLGGGGSWVAAGQALALVASLVTVASAGLLGRVLAGPLAGGLSALATAGMPLVLAGSFWVNPYPSSAAATGVALAAGVACTRRPAWPWALLAGGAAGFAWALDTRGAVLAACVPVLFMLAPVSWRRRFALAGLAILCIAAFYGLDRWVQAHWDLDLVPLGRQVELQHGLDRGPGAPRNAGWVSDLPACQGPRSARLTPGGLFDACASARRALNVRSLHRAYPPPAWLLVALVPLALLPGRRDVRGSAAAAVVFLPGVLVLFVSLSWVPFADRYLLPWAPCIGALGPVACMRAGATAGRWRGTSLVASALALAWTITASPGLRAARDPLSMLRTWAVVPSTGDVREVLARHAASLGPQDLLLDCASMHVQARLMPARPPVSQAPPHDAACLAFARHPPSGAGERWLYTRHPPVEAGMPRTIDPAKVARLGWEEVPFETDPTSCNAGLATEVRRWRLLRMGRADDAASGR
ncbi:MAG: hypothetical protein JXB39_03045 [Deltaproteobacteria bacterium]|nr:hypothetical protein [Deltaproteobacteria bacterium]